MHSILKLLLIFISLIELSGCSAALVPYVKDPAKKLGWARTLYEDQGRPLPAERFIREALDDFQKKGDKFGIAMAYRQYGLFFESAGVRQWQKYYEGNGFLDKSATFSQRFEKSIEYLHKAEEMLEDLSIYDKLTNVQLNMGFVFLVLNQKENACAAFDRSVDSFHKNIQQTPDAKVIIPSGVASYEEYVSSYKSKAGCIK